MKEYFVFKPCIKFTTLPNFQVIEKNRLWAKGPNSILDILTFLIDEWGKKLVVRTPHGPNQPYVVTLNGQQKTIPFLDSNVVGHREDFIHVFFQDPAKKLNLRIETSFGLRLTIVSIGPGQAGPTAI